MENLTEYEVAPHQLSGGEQLRAKIEEALGYPVTAMGEESPVGVTEVEGKLVVRVDGATKAQWGKVDQVVAAHPE